ASTPSMRESPSLAGFEQGIDASLIPHDATDKAPQVVAGIIADQAQAVDFLFDFVGQQRSLSSSYIKELHALMTRKQATASGIDQFGRPVEVPLTHGEYKLHPNNPTQPDGRVFEYCPPEQVASEMDRLVEFHLEHAADDVAAELEAAWLHHRFAQIHPFQDGNGRVARALASLVLIREGWFPLVVASSDRVRYLDNLKAADSGDLRPLTSQFAAVQRTWFRKAIGIGEQVRQAAERTDQLIAAIGDQFRERRVQTRVEMEQAKETSATLAQMATARFRSLRDDISHAIGADGGTRRVFVDFGLDDDDDRRSWHRYRSLRQPGTLRSTTGPTRVNCTRGCDSGWSPRAVDQRSSSRCMESTGVPGSGRRIDVLVPPPEGRRHRTPDHRAGTSLRRTLPIQLQRGRGVGGTPLR
ncbi:MAG: Fic family protein, partial [Rhodococcus sp.]|nr:Fic family protein [Rhodococcus sp. (in: high G+C Gram-positive bacteria)]